MTDGRRGGDTAQQGCDGDDISLSGTDILYDADGRRPSPGALRLSLEGLDRITTRQGRSLTMALNGNDQRCGHRRVAQATSHHLERQTMRSPASHDVRAVQGGGGTANGANDSAFFTTIVDCHRAVQHCAGHPRPPARLSDNGDERRLFGNQYHRSRYRHILCTAGPAAGRPRRKLSTPSSWLRHAPKSTMSWWSPVSMTRRRRPAGIRSRLWLGWLAPPIR